MAFVKETISSRLVLMVQTGEDDEGNPILRSISYSRVSPAAADEDVHVVALAMAELQEYPLAAVRRVDDHKLSDQ
ncbi:MAG TPA: DUF1659 domain-containing protein [Firmicutes bacterium]|jgi:hypothetical protein|nr:DUF1659 domain-containing protein [Bacillota bacterium]